MIIKNITKDKIIGTGAKICNDAFSKFIGLMFSRNQNKTLIFKFDKEQFIRLHMLFVFYPIDVMFLNKNKIVVDIRENFKPFTFYKSKKKAMHVIEMLAGTIRNTKTEIGDKIGF